MNVSPRTFEVNSWLTSNDDEVKFRRLQGDLTTDWLVIGAGFTGVAAAERLAIECPGERVTLVDAGVPGHGSSSRSSGFLVTLGHFDGSDRESQILYNLGQAGTQLLAAQVQRHSIDCHWNDAGRLIGARGDKGIRSLNNVRRVLGKIGSPFEEIDGQTVAECTGMRGYRECVRQQESVLVNPARLLGGLLRALPDSVELYGDFAVSDLARSSSDAWEWNASGQDGNVRAKRVLIANNGMAGQLGIGKHRVFPMRTFVSVFTLSHPDKLSTTDRNWGITSVERVGSSVRRVGDRILIRNMAVHGHEPNTNWERELESMANYQVKAFRRRFGELEFELENTWSGIIGVSANGAQCFGQSAANLFVSCGYNGHGIAQGAISGRLLVDLALGRKSEHLAMIQRLRRPVWIPTGRLLKMGVNAYLNFLSWRFSEEI